MRAAIKYCGGCNPRYNRKEAAARLEMQVGSNLQPAISGVTYDILYVICGCPARCADITSLSAKELRYIDSMQ